ncbi:hypothetical protein J4E85_010378 [Alternaria conjuncta]|uniref:uncharacterized protein n=1 Tax=Alternaria conjuncta TaxID=181017 RepID=UPI002220800B|nr:uncharacterized protein J4E85_010378 [Alternaria conjuncta]KAI4915254.1 hypothetical protein J4E85_010378 [Alternaria conjuncta]
MHCRSIDVGLHSQFDIEKLPEYRPAPRGNSSFTPEPVDEKTSTCSVYVPALPGSTFWIEYAVSPPVPEGHYFLFKLYINGAHVVSWSTGKDEEWQGKTMFGLFESPGDGGDRKKFEKRVLCFTTKDDVNAFDETARVEIRVHRAHGRKRVERQAEEYKQTEHAKTETGIGLVNAGPAGPQHPKRFYKFALIDPVDQPFATFRYYCRSWDQLRDLGLLDQNRGVAGEENDLPVIEPNEGGGTDEAIEGIRASSAMSRDSEDVFQDCKENFDGRAASATGIRGQTRSSSSPTRSTFAGRRTPSTHRASLRLVSDTEQPRAYIPRGAPGPKADLPVEHVGENAQQRHGIVRTPTPFYRLSIPPSIRLGPPEPASRPLPTLPIKNDFETSTSYHPHPAYPLDDWTVRTPSPVKSVRDGISTPPPFKRREQGRSASALMSVIASAWKRRGSQTPDGSLRTDATEDAQRLL